MANPFGMAEGATGGVGLFCAIAVPDPKAESAEFSRECETEGDFDPELEGLKNDGGNLRIE